MASHPYISGPGNIVQMIGYLRRNFPAVVNADTVKKFGLASNNESYVINALQFVGLIDADGKKIDSGADVLLIREETKFQQAFAELVKRAYNDLFDTRGDDAWDLSKDELIGYFRAADKTSDVIGTRQASVFQAFAGLAGRETSAKPKSATGSKPREKGSRPAKVTKPKGSSKVDERAHEVRIGAAASKRDLAMTVRIEINLPAEGTRETYDSIFQSIRANLIDG